MTGACFHKKVSKQLSFIAELIYRFSLESNGGHSFVEIAPFADSNRAWCQMLAWVKAG